MKKKKQSDKNKWIKFSKELHTEWSGCSICGNKKYDIHHIIEFKYWKEYRFEKMNLIPLCKSHHALGKFSAHQHPFWFCEWLKVNQPIQYTWVMSHINKEIIC